MAKYKQCKLKHYWLIARGLYKPQYKVFKRYEKCMSEMFFHCEEFGYDKKWRNLHREIELEFFPNRKKYVQLKILDFFPVLRSEKKKPMTKEVKRKIHFAWV